MSCLGRPLPFPWAMRGYASQTGGEGYITQDATAIEGEEAAFLGKQDSSEFRTSVSRALSGSSCMAPFQLTGSHSFPINAMILIGDPWQDWEFPFHCKSANLRMRACVRFSAMLTLWLQKRRFSFRAHLEAFGLLMCIWSRELESLSSSFFHHFVQ